MTRVICNVSGKKLKKIKRILKLKAKKDIELLIKRRKLKYNRKK